MSRFVTTVESSAALVATAPSGASANALFAAIVAGANQGFILRKVVLGVRAGASAPTSQQVSVACVRTTARGTATTTQTPGVYNPNSATQITGVDTAWSTVPTATWTAPYLHEWSFNTQSGVVDLLDIPEELSVIKGSANGLAFINVGNALPASHLYTATFVWEE